MAKTRNEYQRGLATYSGYVDNLRHVGENDYGRSGDWIDIAVHGGIISCPALVPVSIDDQVIVRGLLRNRGRVIDFVANNVVVCNTPEELDAWEKALNAHYRLTCDMLLGTYDRPTLVNKTITRFTSRFQGLGIQFNIPLEEDEYMRLKPFDRQELDFNFDLIRDFRVTGNEGSRNTIDTWRLTNPVPLVRKSRPAPNVETAAK